MDSDEAAYSVLGVTGTITVLDPGKSLLVGPCSH